MKIKKKEKMKKKDMKKKKEEKLLRLLRMKTNLHLLRLKSLQEKMKKTIIMDKK